jgi:hypothetical protein
MILSLGAIGLLAAALPLVAAPEARTIYVAPDGSDDNAGSRDKPFATVERARKAVRELRGRQTVTVLLRGGTYHLAAPLVLGAEDSGTVEAPVVFAAAPGETPVLSGGRRIHGWKETKVGDRKLWTAELPEVRAGKWYFHQLWVNGRRRVRARYPNDGFLRIAGLPDAAKNTPWNQGQDRFQFAPGDIRRWDNLHEVDVVALHLWVSVRLPIAGLDEKQRLVTFASKSHRRLTEGNEPARYYVENALELLDAPGEWYLNRQSGTLYYWPMPGEDMTRAEVIAPVLTHLVRFEGKPEAKRPVAHVAFRGLTFAHTEWWPERRDPFDGQAAIAVPGVIQGEGMEHCVLEDCTVAHAGNYAIHLGRGCRHNRVAGCDCFDLGGGGIKVGEGVVREDAAQQTHDNSILDNHIHDAGRIFHQAVGVWVGQSYDNRIAHNHIHNLYYTGMSCGWTWGYGKTLARGNRIEHNHVHDLGKGWLSDLGGIYTLGVQPGTIIRGNVFHDIAAHRYGGWGIYFDEGSTDIVAENNLVYRTTHGGFHQHFGKDNLVRNNVFALGHDAQVQRTRPEAHRSFTFERNIVYWKEGKLLAGNWKTLNVAFDHNVYWHVGGGAIRFDGASWEQWRKWGMDAHSLVADPLFVDAAKNDFRLQEQSPALKLGFVPLDLSGVGPRAK